MLKVQQTDLGDERVVSLTHDLELANARVNELETETRYFFLYKRLCLIELKPSFHLESFRHVCYQSIAIDMLFRYQEN